jgi:hypothetical protein
MYANGKGVLKDLSKAKYWIKKAYEGGLIFLFFSCLILPKLKGIPCFFSL